MVGTHTNSTLSYSLWRQGRGWNWGVYDLEGLVVAAGFSEARDDAERAISHIYQASEPKFAAA